MKICHKELVPKIDMVMVDVEGLSFDADHTICKRGRPSHRPSIRLNKGRIFS